MVRFVHLLTHFFVVAFFEGYADFQHAILLADDVLGAECILLAYHAAHFIEHVVVGVAQAAYLGVQLLHGCYHVFATLAAFVVGRRGEVVLHLRVEEHEFVALGVEGEVLVLQRAAVEAHEAALLAEDRGKLVHDAAVATDVVVLGGLAYLGERELVYFVFAEEVVECEGESAFEGSRGRHASTEGHVAGKGGVETLNVYAELHHFAANAVDEAEVGGRGAFVVVERELHVVLEVDGVGAYLAGAVGLDFSNHALLNGAGEHETAVVVGVFADEVDAAGRGIYRSCAAVKVFDETASYVFDSQFHRYSVLEVSYKDYY